MPSASYSDEAATPSDAGYSTKRHFLIRGGEQTVIDWWHRDIFEAVVEALLPDR